jgi:hypothetical protein
VPVEFFFEGAANAPDTAAHEGNSNAPSPAYVSGFLGEWSFRMINANKAKQDRELTDDAREKPAKPSPQSNRWEYDDAVVRVSALL